MLLVESQRSPVKPYNALQSPTRQYELHLGRFPFCSLRFFIKLPNTKKGALFLPRLLGILAIVPGHLEVAIPGDDSAVEINVAVQVAC